MNNYKTTKEEEYACVQYELPDEELIIVGYVPIINTTSVHHILTYGCTKRGTDQQYWSGEAICAGEKVIIHLWTLNGSSFILSEDIGLPVGRNSPFKYIIVHIHYLSFINNDNSGNQLIMSRTPRKYHLGLLIGGTGQINLPANTQNIRVRFSCFYHGPSISIFAVRVHTHQWGRVNSLYRIRNESISKVVKQNSQLPQSFYFLKTPIEIQYGDYLIGQCIYDNYLNRTIQGGLSEHNEMCTVTAMYSYNVINISNQTEINYLYSHQSCWDNRINQIANLIPPDSEIPPVNQDDFIQTTDYLNTTYMRNSSKVVPAKSIFNQIYFSHKNFSIYLIRMLIIVCITIIFIIIGFIIGKRKIRIIDNLNGLFININRYNIFDKWINKRQGFEKLNQYSDDENQQL